MEREAKITHIWISSLIILYVLAHATQQLTRGVFDICTLASLAGEPGYGQPRPGCRGQRLLFDWYVPSEPGLDVIVFDLL